MAPYGLVSKIWLPRSRQHQFSLIDLRNASASSKHQFVTLITSPLSTIVSHVRYLRLGASEGSNDHELINSLVVLTSVVSVGIYNTGLSWIISPVINLLGGLPALRTLCLESCFLTTLGELILAIGACSHLEALILKPKLGLKIPVDDAETNGCQLAPPSSLKTLEIAVIDGLHDFLRWLASAKPPLLLHSLTINDTTGINSRCAAELLEKAGASLRKLSLGHYNSSLYAREYQGILMSHGSLPRAEAPKQTHIVATLT